VTVDIAHANGNAIAVLGGANEALGKLGEWVQAARHAHQLVAPLIGTAFVPDAYKPKIDPRATPEQKAEARETAIANATAAVLQGITLGLDPMTAMQQIYIVHGRPGMYTEIKVALVKSRGHEVWTEDISDSRAVVCGRRKGSEYTERVTVTMDQARKAGWTTNQAYTKTPQDMLYARAAGRVCDRIAPDVLMGIASVEEIQDTIQVEATVGNGTRTVSPRKRAAAAPAITAAAEDPPLEAETVAETPAEPAQLMTKAQSSKLHALLGQAGLGDRDEGLAYLSSQVGRDITSSKELTKAEATRLIDRLETPAEPDEQPSLDDEGDGDWPATAAPPGSETP
jgi:hypothetical protein